jgi:hypothetical protein
MEPKHRTLLQAVVLLAVLAVIVYNYEPAPDQFSATTEQSMK